MLFVSALHVGARFVERMATDQMAAAANTFLSTLPAELAARANLALTDPDITRWHFIPPEGFPRAGVPLSELSPQQSEAVQALLKAGLSQRGYQTAIQIMALENLLRELEQSDRFARDARAYFITVFGSPAPGGTWAWRFEGHHLSLHFAVADGRPTVSTPSFLGASPAEIRTGSQRGQRALAAVEDAAFALINSLDPTQLKDAVFSDSAPADILTGVQVPAPHLSPAGLTVARMSAEQKVLLRGLLEAHSGMMNPEIATVRWRKINDAGLDAIAFAWAGARHRGMPHYYRVQGPTFLVEYDNTQNGANHVHTVWRDFAGDFGRDLIREHRSSVPH
ncbi:DUF3500 domain-containing protein [soil metagenome]